MSESLLHRSVDIAKEREAAHAHIGGNGAWAQELGIGSEDDQDFFLTIGDCIAEGVCAQAMQEGRPLVLTHLALDCLLTGVAIGRAMEALEQADRELEDA